MTAETTLIRVQSEQFRRVPFMIWSNVELRAFGYAVDNGKRPNSLPFADRETAAKQARKAIIGLINAARADGTMTVDVTNFAS